MKKLHLRLDELAVESFPTTVVDVKERGTVRGHHSLDCPTPDGFCAPETVQCSYWPCTHDGCDFTYTCETRKDCVYTTTD